MFNRREFLIRSLQTSSLLAVGSAVPEFVAGTARAAEAGKDTVLVVVELTGGNDGLNTVIPYADDLYHKARPKLRQSKNEVVRVNDHIGLNAGMRSLDQLLQKGQLAIVQGVGYPNPDRSHFQSMDIWQSADLKRETSSGWLGRSVGEMPNRGGGVPILHVGRNLLPLALCGAAGGTLTINNGQPYRLELGGGSAERHQKRRRLLEDLSRPAAGAKDAGLLGFVQRRQVETLSTIDRLQEVLRTNQTSNGFFSQAGRRFYQANSLPVKLQLVARLIAQGFGTRIFYVALNGFDTHAAQAETHRNLLAELADGVTEFFNALRQSGHDQRVRLMTFSEFGRRVQENGSKGTDHGAASCLFVAGPSVQGGVVGEHPSLKDLAAGDLKHHTDFRRVYATLLDSWLHCDSRAVLGARFEHVAALRSRI